MPPMSEIEELARAIKVVQWRHHRALDSRLRTLGSTLAQWDTLRAIDTFPGASGHDLAMATFQSDQAFGALANRLLAQQLITRNPGEGRRIQHHLTPKGKALLEAGRAEAREVLSTSFADLSVPERAKLKALLDRIGDVSEMTSPGPI
jgi:DNA-binding MarR family transcriptional regulator